MKTKLSFWAALWVGCALFPAFGVEHNVAKIADHLTSATALVVDIGDVIKLPDANYTNLNRRVVTCTGPGVFRATEAGIAGIQPKNGAADNVMCVVVLPDDVDKSRVFIYSSGSTWTTKDSWVKVDGTPAADYPHLADDVAFIPVKLNDKTISWSEDIVVGQVYFGGWINDYKVKTTLKASGSQTLTFKRTDGKAACLRQCPNHQANISELLLGTGVFLCESDTVLDLGWDNGGETSADWGYCVTKFTFNALDVTVPKGIHLTLCGGSPRSHGSSSHESDFGFSGTNRLRGEGVLVSAGRGLYTHWFHCGDFHGEILVCDGPHSGGYDRSGNFQLMTATVGDTAMTVAGFAVRSNSNADQYDANKSIGFIKEGTEHSYGSSGETGNRLPWRGLTLRGGYGEFAQEYASWGAGKVQSNYTARLTVDRGFSYIVVSASDNASYPINTLHAKELDTATGDKGTLLLRESNRSAGKTTTYHSAVILPTFAKADESFGAGEDCTKSEKYSVRPNIVARYGAKSNYEWCDLMFASVDASGRLLRQQRTSKFDGLPADSATVNAYVDTVSLALTHDLTVNSLAVDTQDNNTDKGRNLGAGRKLTIVSGGLILNDNWTGIGAPDAGDEAGLLEFGDIAYVWATARAATTPNTISAKVTAPKGLVLAMPGHLQLIGDQRGIQGEIVANAGTLYLGAADGSKSAQVSADLRIYANATINMAASPDALDGHVVRFDDVNGHCGKLVLPDAANATCSKMYVRDAAVGDGSVWASVASGTYGATGSGAEIIDDEHFSGTGMLTVLRDDFGWPVVENVGIKEVRETMCVITGHVASAASAEMASVYTLFRIDGEDAVKTNGPYEITGEVDIIRQEGDLTDGVKYHVAIYVENDVPTGDGGTERYSAQSDWLEFETMKISNAPQIVVDTEHVRGQSAVITIPWTLVSPGYNCELVQLEIRYGTSADKLNKVFPLETDILRGDYETRIGGLALETVYYFQVYARNDYKGDGEEYFSEIFSAKTELPMSAVGGTIRAIGADKVVSFAQDGTMWLPEDVTARVLAVGGGGGGGSYQGVGGAGGEVKDETVTLSRGNYKVYVGAGGNGGTSNSSTAGNSTAGGTTRLVLLDDAGTETDVFSAKGGKGGANASTAYRYSSGGAGAGGPGGIGSEKFTSNPYYTKSGDGGVGIASDITGERLTYGGGGGGGVYVLEYGFASCTDGNRRMSLAGNGGAGGGGRGGGGYHFVNTYAAPQDGEDGLGGGGGGGMRNNSKTDQTEWYYGAKGGAGALVIRLANSGGAPEFSVETGSGFDYVGLDIRLDFAGLNATKADFTVRAGPDVTMLESVGDGEYPSVVAGETIHVAACDLQPNQNCVYEIVVTNNLGESAAVTGTVRTAVRPGTITVTNGEQHRDGDWVIATFADTVNAGYLTLSARTHTDVLTIAGGGAGGYRRAGGGGAGGLVYRRGVELPDGYYEIHVGAGGTPVADTKKTGGNGGDSVVIDAGKNELVHARGGGGGAGYEVGDRKAFGSNGGSGGGSTYRTLLVATGEDGQGFHGGAGMPNENNGGGGGGGAGEPGHCYIRQPFQGGNGGDGREIAITGEPKWYAGGGGGGIYFKSSDGTWRYSHLSFGGRGGGGNGGGSAESDLVRSIAGSSASFAMAENGVDGLGGGGGGGGDNSDSSSTYSGGKGGSGVVVFRCFVPEGEIVLPMITVRGLTADDRTGATFAYHLESLGAQGGHCAIEAVYGIDPDNLCFTQRIAENVVRSGEATLGNLLPGMTYYVKLRAINDMGESSLTPLEVVKMPCRAFDGVASIGRGDGLMQTSLIGEREWNEPLESGTPFRRELGAVMGTINGTPGKSGWTYVSPYDGVTNEWAESRTFGYSGLVYLRRGTYEFAIGIDDYGLVKIGGETIIDADYSCAAETGMFVAHRDGWYPIEVRMGNLSGGAGYYSSNWNGYGLSYRCVSNRFAPTSDSFGALFCTFTNVDQEDGFFNFLWAAAPDEIPAELDIYGIPQFDAVWAMELTGSSAHIFGSMRFNGGVSTRLTLHFGTTTNVADMADIDCGILPASRKIDKALDGLSPGVRYFYYLTAETEKGVKVETEVKSFVEPASGATALNAIFVENDKGRVVKVRAGLSGLGAEASMTVVAYARPYDRTMDNRGWIPIGSTICEHDGPVEVICDCRTILNFGELWQFRLVATGQRDGQSFTLDTLSTDCNARICDYSQYTWTGAAGNGKWDDAGNWSVIPAADDYRGYPTAASTATFPSGTKAVVTLPDMPYFRIKKLVLGEGTSDNRTALTFVGKRENVFMIEKPYGNPDYGNGAFEVSKFCDFTLDGASLTKMESTGTFYVREQATLTLCHGAAFSTASEIYMTGDGNKVLLTGDSFFEATDWIRFGGTGSEWVIDNSYVESRSCERGIILNEGSKTGGKIIFRGDHPRLTGSRVYGNSTTLQSLYFEVPRGGYSQAPIFQIRNSNNNQQSTFATSSSKFELYLSPDSPALLYGEKIVNTPIVDFYNGFSGTSGNYTLKTDNGASWTKSARYGSNDRVISLSFTPTPVAGTDPEEYDANPVVSYAGEYIVYTWTNTAKRSVFNVPMTLTGVDYLIVGGGGAGGWGHYNDENQQSGGGGAGGMIYKTGQSLSAGTYVIAVGAGGSNRPWDLWLRSSGMNGGASCAFGQCAFGGGGGSAYSDGNHSYGQAGGSGGGGGNGTGTAAVAIDANQGKNGGTGGGNNCGGGGGGAGGAGKNGNSPANSPGAGGDGKACSITGIETYYAGGGGAGASARNSVGGSGGAGGLGGGGTGAGRSGMLATDGADGFGGGGGGGAFNADRRYDVRTFDLNKGSVFGPTPGGKGGDGVVILRVKNPDIGANAPLVQFRKVVSVSENGAEIEWEYVRAGNGATVGGSTFFVEYGTDGTTFDKSLALPNQSSTGVKTSTIKGFGPETTYYCRLVVKNSNNVTYADPNVFVVTTDAARAFQFGGTRGFYQAKKTGTSDYSGAWDIASDSGGVIVSRAEGCYNNESGSWTDIQGAGYKWEANTVYGYYAYWWLEAGKTYVIGGTIDDVLRINVYSQDKSSTKVSLKTDTWNVFKYTTFTVDTSGYYPVDVRACNGSGGAGIVGNVGAGFNTDNIKSDTTTGWTRFDGATGLFHTAIPVREIRVKSYAKEGARLKVVLSIGVGSAADLYVASGTMYGGRALEDWESKTKIKTVDSAAEEYLYEAELASLDGARYLRFFVSNETGASGSEVIYLDDLTKPTFSSAEPPTVDELWRGDGFKVVAQLAYDGGDAGCEVAAEVSRTSDFAAFDTFALASDGAGRYAGLVSGVTPGERVYVRVRATAAGGSSVSETTAAVPLAGAVFGKVVTGSISGRNVTLSTTMSDTGAHLEGETHFIRILGAPAGGEYEPLTDFAPQSAAAVSATAVGGQPGEAWTYCLECSNCCASAAWLVRSDAVTLVSADNSTYVWTGAGKDTLWSNPDNWTGGGEGGIGYPFDASSIAQFPANASGTVTLDRGYTVGKVEFKGDCSGKALVFVSSNPALRNGSIAATFNYDCTNREIDYEDVSVTDNSGDATPYNKKAGNVMKLLGKTDYVHPNKFIFISDGGYFELGPAAKLRITNDSKPACFGGNDVLVRIDGTLDSREVIGLNDYGNTVLGGKLVIGGTAPSLVARNTFTTYSTGRQRIAFRVPVGGYAAAPMRLRDPASGSLLDLFASAKDAIDISVDPQSDGFVSGVTNTVALIDWRNAKSKTIDTSKVTLGNSSVKGTVEFFWTYGSDAHETQVGGEKPTGLSVRLFKPRSMYMIVR